MERRFLESRSARVRVERREDKRAVVVGYAAVFWDPAEPGTQYELYDDLVERVMPGCFDRAMMDGDDCRALFNHDPNLILGRTTAGTCRLSVDRKGLRYEIDMPDTMCATDVVKHIERGDVTGSSFSFLVESYNWQEEGNVAIRGLTGVKLYDVGPVTFPAYEATSVGLRAVEGAADIRKALDAWRAHRDEVIAVYSARAREIETELAKESTAH
jgi:HK97 family phage prohead protease